MVESHRRKSSRVGNELPNPALNNEVFKRVEKIKYFRINIDEGPNWKEQYRVVKNEVKGA